MQTLPLVKSRVGKALCLLASLLFTSVVARAEEAAALASQSRGQSRLYTALPLAGRKIVSGLSHFNWGGENYFMLVAEPPKRIPAEQVTAREYRRVHQR